MPARGVGSVRLYSFGGSMHGDRFIIPLRHKRSSHRGAHYGAIGAIGRDAA